MTAPWNSDSSPGLPEPERPLSLQVDPPPYPASFYETVQEDDVEICRGPLWKRILKWSVPVALALFTWYSYESSRPLPEAGPFEEPVQQALTESMRLPGPDGFEFEARDTYEISALVLSRARYRWDNQSSFCPVDLALAWGPITTRAALDSAQYSQSTRWYWFRVNNDASVTHGDISNHSANTHIIPATGDSALRSQILSIKRGDRVRLTGYLVDVYGPRGMKITTSRRRDDGGGGSCEILYVTEMEKLE